MGKILVLIESPGKLNLIQSFLGSDYRVMATYGHIYDLPSKGMSIDIEHDFKPTYEVIPTKRDVVNRISSEAERADRILLASDEDREGAFISYACAVLFKVDVKSKCRITYNEITKTAILDAVKKAGPLEMNMVYAQQARRFLDRIIGYTLSPLVHLKIPGAVSAGRVQSAVLKMIVDKQRERDAFFENGADSFYKVRGIFRCKTAELKTILYELAARNGEEKKDVDEDEDEIVEEQGGSKKRRIVSQIAKNSRDTREIEKFMEAARRSSWKVGDVTDSISIRRPAPPFMTSSVQTEAATKLGFTVKRTTSTLQSLFQKGHITYIRTDSIVMSKTATDEIAGYLKSNFDKEYLQPRVYKNKGATTQESHECIRPTHFEVENLTDGSSDEQRLYQLIWRRAVASQMAEARVAVKEIAIIGSKLDSKYEFIARLERLIFPGFLAVYNYKSPDEDEVAELDKKADIKSGTSCERLEVVAKQEFSSPPPMYSEASLVSAMKRASVARPATTSSTIEKLVSESRSYANIEDIEGQRVESNVFTLQRDDVKREGTETFIGRERKKIVPTTLGIRVTEFLERYFSALVDIGYTADMERKLDEIAAGKKDWKKVLHKFYDEFAPTVDKVKKKIKEEKLARGDEPEYDRKLGKDKIKGEIYTKLSRYGPTVFYIDKEAKKAVYAKIPKGMKIEKITLEEALKLLSYPKLIGTKGDKEVWIKRGPYGYYLERDGLRAPIPEGADPEDIDLKQAVELIKDATKKREEKYLYEFSTDKAEYAVMRGEKGNFVMIRRKDKKGEVQKKGKPLFVGIGERDPKSITEEIAEELLKEKGERRGKGRGSKRASGQTFAESGSTDAGQSGGRGRKSGRAGRGSQYGGGGGTTSKRAGGSRGKSVSFASSTKRGSRSASKPRSLSSKPRSSSSKPQRQQQRSAKSRGRGRR
jgi:DNA topoisomerase-1